MSETLDDAVAPLLIELAFLVPRGTNMSPDGELGSRLVKFRDEIRSDERERCAQVCRDVAKKYQAEADLVVGQRACDDVYCRRDGAEACAEAIEREG